MTGGDDDLDRRPPVPYGCRQFQSVHAAGHIDVRKQQPDVWNVFQDGNCFVGVGRLMYIETFFGQMIHKVEAKEGLIFDDKD